MARDPGPEERRRRRQLLRAQHPDLGGDPEEFIATVASFESAAPGPGTTAAPAGPKIRFVQRPRGLARVTAWYRRRGRPPRVQ